MALDGSIQLLLGPEASLVGWQTKVRCSTRATSVGEERWRYAVGQVLWLRGWKMGPLRRSSFRPISSRRAERSTAVTVQPSAAISIAWRPAPQPAELERRAS